MEVVDAHHHLWRVARGDYVFFDAGRKPIQRDFLLPELAGVTAGRGITGSVVIQCAATESETRFLLELAAASSGLVKGVVGWADLAAPDIDDTLARLSRDALLKGLRIVNPAWRGIAWKLDLSAPDWLLHPGLERAFSSMEKHGLTFDALVKAENLPSACELLQRHPALRLVIDHAARPTGNQVTDRWRGDIRRLASQTDAHVKLSGIGTHASANWGYAECVPIFSEILDAFGSRRVMWGSDWPMSEMYAGYGHWWNVTQKLVSKLAAEERGHVMGDTATRFYRLAAHYVN